MDQRIAGFRADFLARPNPGRGGGDLFSPGGPPSSYTALQWHRLGIPLPTLEGSVWPPLLSAREAVATCGLAPDEPFTFLLIVPPGAERWEVRARASADAAARCLEGVLAHLSLTPLLSPDTTLIVQGQATPGALDLALPRPDHVVDGHGYVGSFLVSTTTITERLRGVNSAQLGQAPFFRLEAEGVRRVQELLACPSAVPVTTLSLDWRAEAMGLAPAGLTVRTDPQAPCVEQRARDHWDALVAVLYDQGWIVGVEGMPSPPSQKLGELVRQRWPEGPPEIHYQTNILLPEVSP